VLIANPGTGSGFSVLKMIESLEAASGVKIPDKIIARRSGDVRFPTPIQVSPRRPLDWQATLGLNRIC
jgi:UDP-glucose 4-epimerase